MSAASAAWERRGLPVAGAPPAPTLTGPTAPLAAPRSIAAGNMKPRKGKKDYSAFAYHCLVRATDGSRKLSTVVQGKDLAKFYDSYTTIQRVSGVWRGECGAGMQAQGLALHCSAWCTCLPPPPGSQGSVRSLARLLSTGIHAAYMH